MMDEEVITDRILDIGEYRRYYLHEWWCINCGNRNACYIKKKKKIDGIIVDCDKCECATTLKSYMEED